MIRSKGGLIGPGIGGFNRHTDKEETIMPMESGLRRRSVIGSALGLGSAAAWPSIRSAQAAAPLRIGILNDMAGPYSASTGLNSVEAAKMAVEDFGPAVLGRPIEVLAGDHQNKTDIGVAVMKEWLGPGGVSLIADYANSAVALAAQGLVKDANKVSIPVSVATSDLSGKACVLNGIHWAHDNWANSVALVRAFRDAGKTSFYFVTVDYSFGLSFETDAKKEIERSGGKVLGAVRHPLGTTDFGSYLLSAQASGADVVFLASSGADVQNAVKQATEFGLTPRQVISTPSMYVSDIHGIGLDRAQGLEIAQDWYWDLNEDSRAWSRKFFSRRGRMPTDMQAALYSAVLHYLKGVQKAGTDAGDAVVTAMKTMPVNDMFARDARIRDDGKLVFDRYLMRVKTPATSNYPWDYLETLAIIPANKAFRPLSDSECPMIHKAI